jgi:hypothetical protein
MSQKIPEKQYGEAATPICGDPNVTMFLTGTLVAHFSTMYLAINPP